MIQLADLEGRWRLERRIDDRRAAIVGHLDGEVTWRPDGAGLRQEEQGVLRYGDAPEMQASRVYLWRATSEGIAVFFEDGRPFHELRHGAREDRHLCPPDTYDVRYDFGDWPTWRQVWHVTGPRKDAIIDSVFQRF